MAQPKRLRLYLDDGLRESAAKGAHNFLGLVEEVARDAGYEVILRPNTTAERLRAQGRRGYGLMHMTPPANARCLTFRRVYHYPFWQIDTSEKRWKWRVAEAEFDSGQVDRTAADKFFRFWQRRLLEPLLDDISDEGFLYVPLQGRLLDRRSFQTASPLNMIRQARKACPRRRLIATLHPKETYTQEERAALEAIACEDPMIEIGREGRDAYLPRCHAVVTQNSSVAFDGYFLRKPAVLYAGVDFHHIALFGTQAQTYDRLETHAPDYAGYIWWFWQQNAINAGHENARARIAERFAAAGWPMA